MFQVLVPIHQVRFRLWISMTRCVSPYPRPVAEEARKWQPSMSAIQMYSILLKPSVKMAVYVNSTYRYLLPKNLLKLYVMMATGTLPSQ